MTWKIVQKLLKYFTKRKKKDRTYGEDGGAVVRQRHVTPYHARLVVVKHQIQMLYMIDHPLLAGLQAQQGDILWEDSCLIAAGPQTKHPPSLNHLYMAVIMWLSSC